MSNYQSLSQEKYLDFVLRTSLLLMSFTLFAVFGDSFSNLHAYEARSIDGTNNHHHHTDWGSTNTPLLRKMDPDYANGHDAPAGPSRPSARMISNILATQTGLSYNSKRATDFLWQWGQFIDHDIDLTEGADPAESFAIPIPAGDVYFDPSATGTKIMPFHRSDYVSDSTPRQQMNHITAFLDASMVYGSDPERAHALRTKDGTGRLKMSKGRLLPFNVDGLPNAGGPDPNLFVAGDVRANEQVGLIAMHTLFVREHNRLAKKIRKRDETLSGDEVYERTRRKVGALIQIITYNEFLPILLGKHALRPYRGYKPWVNPSIANIFSTAAYRLGHSMLSPQLLRLKKNGNPSVPVISHFVMPSLHLGELSRNKESHLSFVDWPINERKRLIPILLMMSETFCLVLRGSVVLTLRHSISNADETMVYQVITTRALRWDYPPRHHLQTSPLIKNSNNAFSMPMSLLNTWMCGSED